MTKCSRRVAIDIRQRRVLKGTRVEIRSPNQVQKEEEDHGIDKMDGGGPDCRVAGGTSDEGRGLRDFDGHYSRDSRRPRRRLGVWSVGTPRERLARNHHSFLCRRGDSGVDLAAGEKEVERTGR